MNKFRVDFSCDLVGF